MLICVPLGPHLDVELLNHSGDLCSPGIDAANQFSKAVHGVGFKHKQQHQILDVESSLWML